MRRRLLGRNDTRPVVSATWDSLGLDLSLQSSKPVVERTEIANDDSTAVQNFSETPAWPESRPADCRKIFHVLTGVPLHIRSTRKLTLNEAPIVTAVGKAFWDIVHAPKNRSNRRKNLPGYVVWEIHPVMTLQIVDRKMTKK